MMQNNSRFSKTRSSCSGASARALLQPCWTTRYTGSRRLLPQATTSRSRSTRSAPEPDGYRNMIVLERHTGDHALYINEDEREFLLPRGTTWHVVKAVNVENLTVQADFPLHHRTATTASFDHVRLIYVTEATCI